MRIAKGRRGQVGQINKFLKLKWYGWEKAQVNN